MSKTFIITPSILSANFSCLKDQIVEAEAAGADWIHIDVMDGHFVPNLTMGPFIVEACRQMTRLPLDVHLMVEEPERMLEAFAKAGANLLYVHQETCPNLHRTLQNIRELGCKPGVVLNPATPAAAIQQVLYMVDLILVMTVNPGFSGQKFIPEVIPKIAQLRSQLDEVNPSAMIAVDGGITAATLSPTAAAGANVFIASTAIFKHPKGIADGIQELRASISKYAG